VTPSPSFFFHDRGSLKVGESASMDAFASNLASEMLVPGPLEDEDPR
jgi:hypothetical protein